MSQPDHDPLGLPPRLGDELRRAYAHRVTIPATVDDAVLAAARERFAQRRRLRLVVRWGTGLAAGLAAAVVMGIVLHRPAAAPSGPLAKGDVNADGQVNIVDALALARHVANHDGPNSGWDVNGDGAIDQKDVDTIASASVSLKNSSLAKASLPSFRDLGLPRHPVGLAVGLASASGTPSQPQRVSLADASSTRDPREEHP